MNEFFDLKSIFVGFCGVLIAIAGWFGKRELDRTATRLDALEKCAVTRDELERLMTQARHDRMAQHQENREFLGRIERKIDENEERSSKTRHDTKDEVHELKLRLAVLTRDLNDDR
jgi:hypothetical protein